MENRLNNIYEAWITTTRDHIINPNTYLTGIDTNIPCCRFKLNTTIKYDDNREFIVTQLENCTIIQLSYFDFTLDELNIHFKKCSSLNKELSFVMIKGKKRGLWSIIETDVKINLKKDAYDIRNSKYSFYNNILTIIIPYKNANNK